MTDKESPQVRYRRHQEAVEWFFRLQNEEQSTEQTEQWIEWCNADPANQRTFEHLMPLWQARQAMPGQVPHVPSNVLPLADRYAERRRPSRSQRWVVLAAAASVIVAVAGALLYPRLSGGEHLAAVSEMKSETGQARLAQLADGSHVALGAQSKIAVNFIANRRDIRIERGEALFTVQHDRSRPFVVSVGAVQVVAVGTVFDVDRRGDRVSVTVQDGVVEVSDSRQGTTAPMRVARGSQLIIDQSGREGPSLRVVNPDVADAWRRGHFEYVAEPLASVIEDLNRYTNKPIVLQGNDIGALRYSGTIELTAINEWLRALPSIFDVHVDLGDEHQVTLTAGAGTTKN